jgi:large subunit ribosomal protein L2
MNLKQKFLLICKQKNLLNKYLSNSKVNSGGRNIRGKITVRGRGSKSRKKFRIIDYHRALWHIPAFLKRIEFDPNRSTLISFFIYYNGICSYVITVEDMRVGNIYSSGVFIRRKLGNSFPLKFIPAGTEINSVEYKIFSGAIFLRSNGSYGKLLRKLNKICIIRLKSGSLKRINLFCIATIGRIMNFNYFLNRFKNAGYNRLRGFKSKVRGVAMNPVDHPYGGGEGKKSKKSICMSP